MLDIPVADGDAVGELAPPYDEGPHGAVPVHVRTFQLILRRPGIGVVSARGERDGELWVVLRDRELDRLARAYLFKVQDQIGIELARVADIARHCSREQLILDADIHKE